MFSPSSSSLFAGKKYAKKRRPTHLSSKSFSRRRGFCPRVWFVYEERLANAEERKQKKKRRRRRRRDRRRGNKSRARFSPSSFLSLLLSLSLSLSGSSFPRSCDVFCGMREVKIKPKMGGGRVRTTERSWKCSFSLFFSRTTS